MSPAFGAVMFFGLKADHDTHNRFVRRLKAITLAVSFDTTKSWRQYLCPEKFHNGFFRFSVGIEDAEDITAVWNRALEKIDLNVLA